MGRRSIKPAHLFLACLSLTATGLLGQPSPPANLPKPPPLPPEILERKPPAPPPDLPDPSELKAQLHQLEELLSMTPEQLKKLRETIEIIEKKSAAEKEAMRIRLRQVTQMTEELRQEISTFHAFVPEIKRSDLTQFWLALEASQRESMREELAQLSAEEKTTLLTNRVNAFNVKKNRVFSEMRKAIAPPE